MDGPRYRRQSDHKDVSQTSSLIMADVCQPFWPSGTPPEFTNGGDWGLSTSSSIVSLLTDDDDFQVVRLPHTYTRPRHQYRNVPDSGTELAATHTCNAASFHILFAKACAASLLRETTVKCCFSTSLNATLHERCPRCVTRLPTIDHPLCCPA